MNDEFKKYHCTKIEENYKRLVMKRYVCKKCHNETLKAEDSTFVMDVIPPQDGVESIPDLEEMIVNTFQDSVLEKQCEECDSAEFSWQYAVQQMPKVSVIAIKRFLYDQNTQLTQKLQTKVNVSQKMMLKLNASWVTLI